MNDIKKNYIICKKHNQHKFKKLGYHDFCNLEDMILYNTIAFDSETDGLVARKNDVFCCQIGNGIDSNYLIVLYDDNYTFDDVIPYIQGKVLVGHNILFDLGFMYKYGFYPKKVKDTMLASKIIYNGDILNIRQDFASMMQRELNIFYDKTDQKNIHTVKLSQPSTILYSFNDVDKLLEAHAVLETKIKNLGFSDTYDLHCKYIRALAYMEQCGLGISSERWKSKMEEDILNVDKYNREIIDYIHDNLIRFRDGQLDMFNDDKKILVSLTSPLQMVEVFNEFGIETKDQDGKDSINEGIISKSKHEFVEKWLKFQESQHRVSTFGQKIYDQIENERIYTSFNPMVDTARLSSRKGAINFLNFPSDAKTRNCFNANKGNKIIVCDYSGQETVIAADLSGDEAMSNAVINNEDLHCMLAKVLFPELKDMSDEEIIKNHKDKRQASKGPRFAMSYGGSAYTLHVNEGITMERATEIEKAYKELHKGLYEWGEQVYITSINNGYIESADGWKLKLPRYEEFLDLKHKMEEISREDWKIYKEGKNEFKKWKQAKEDKKKYLVKNQNSFDFYQSLKHSVSSFFKLKSEYMRLCLNNPVQSTGAHQLKLATASFFEWIEKKDYLHKVLITNTIHDRYNCCV